MASRRRPVYWDTCVFLDCLQKQPDRYPDIKRIIDEAESKRVMIVTSTLTVAECAYVRKDAPQDQREQVGVINAFFRSEFIECWPVDRTIAELAAEILREYGISGFDAVHLATAMEVGCEAFYTYDGEHRGTAPKRRGIYLLDFDGKIGSPPLKIQTCDKFFLTGKPLFDTPPEIAAR